MSGADLRRPWIQSRPGRGRLRCSAWARIEVVLRMAGWAGAWLAAGWWCAAADGDGVRRYPATADLHFAGTSTLHDFGGRLASQPFFLILSNGTWSATADVLAAEMATAHAKRDCKMHEMFATNAFPRIVGVVAGAPVPGAAGTNAVLRLKIRDQSRDGPVRISAWTETDRAITFRAAWDVSLKDFQLKPPSVIGLIRVGDRVRLEATVTANKSVTAPPPPTLSP